MHSMHYTTLQVKDFVSRFMPAYYTYLPRLYTHGPPPPPPPVRIGADSSDSVPVLKVRFTLRVRVYIYNLFSIH